MAPDDLHSEVTETATQAYGAVPNLLEEINRYTAVPGAVYLAADAALMDGLLTPSEQQAVLLTMAEYHNSRYDAVAHARMALDAGVAPAAIDRILAGDTPRDARLKALVEATRRSCEDRGWLEPEVLRAFEEQGVGRGELYEIFAFIGLKTFTSFTAHMADPEVDGSLQDTEATLEHVPDEPDTIERQRLFMG
jgi:alkylhydroperoxidase family enzyme